MKTFDGKYDYSTPVYYNITLREMTNMVHKTNCEANGWQLHILKNNSYGLDTLSESIMTVIENKHQSFYDLCVLVHTTWSEVYKFWRDNYHDECGKVKPYTPFGDERRDNLSSLHFDDLPEDEKKKDEIVVKCVLDIIFNPLIKDE